MRHLLLLPGLAIAMVTGCGSTTEGPEEPVVRIPAGFPAMPVPNDNRLTTERIALGKRLFFDKDLSRTREVSCGSCHLQENAFADPRRYSLGIEGKKGDRNAPALVNMAWNNSFFWDGGVPTLEQQAIAPIINPVEMDMTLEGVVERVKSDASYVQMFRDAYGSGPEPAWVTKAIASFVRTLVSGHSRYDRFLNGDPSALAPDEERGRQLFFGERAECFHCHIGFNLTNNTFQNNGLYLIYADSGRARITERSSDIAKFKVPTLRNIAVTSPYMHDGSLATLEEVVEHYAEGGKLHPNQSQTIRPLDLTPEEKRDLVAFLRALTDEAFLSDPEFRE